MVHCRSDRFAWRSTWILGRARVTIDASRRIIKAPRQVTTSVITWLARWVVLIICSNLLHVHTLYVHVFYKKTLRPTKNSMDAWNMTRPDSSSVSSGSVTSINHVGSHPVGGCT